MQPSTCSGVQPGASVVSLERRIAGRLAARSTASYSGRPAVEIAAFDPPVTVGSLGPAGLPSGPITLGSQS